MPQAELPQAELPDPNDKYSRQLTYRLRFDRKNIILSAVRASRVFNAIETLALSYQLRIANEIIYTLESGMGVPPVQKGQDGRDAHPTRTIKM